MIDSLIFDVDGTIWDTTPVVAVAWNKAIDRACPGQNYVTADILKTQFGKTMDVIANNLFPEISKEQQTALMQYCCEEEHIALENCNDDLRYSGLNETFEKLSKKIPLYIVSNCQAGYIEIVIERTGIKSFVEDFECFGNTGKGKAENIQLLINRNGLKNPVYIGDTQGDYEACQKANVPFIWAAYGFGKPEDDNYFAKINELPDLLKIIG